MNFRIYSLKDHAKNKGMWAGALKRVTIPNLRGLKGGKIYPITADHTPALFKIFDEVIVNACDHAKEHATVTEINLTFVPGSGIFCCHNNGPGFPIQVHPGASIAAGRDVYIPELAACNFLAGTCLEKSDKCIKGGTNGIGLKLAVVHSKRFILETIDAGKKYKQIIDNRLEVIHPPEIYPFDGNEGTRITFLPAYTELGYSDVADIIDWLALRAALASCYLQFPVTLNKSSYRYTLREIAELFGDDAEYFDMASGSLRFTVAVGPTIKKFDALSIINGIVCYKGTHISYIRKAINDEVQTYIQKITKEKKTTTLHMRLIIAGTIPNIEWTGQRKDELSCPEAMLAKLFPLKLTEVVTCLANKNITTSRRKTNPVKYDKYIAARKLSKRRDCMLLAAEGDSAISFLRAGLTQNSAASFDQYGIISLGGVIMNARKNSNEVIIDGESYILQNRKLNQNVVLQNIISVLGLDFKQSYDTPESIKKLKYAGIIGCVDQDLDGCGKILSLLLGYFHLFWPNLIKFGFVKRFITPVIRVYPSRGPPTEYFYEHEFRNDDTTGRVKYFKGLATHSDEEITSMFANFHDRIYTFTLDAAANKTFEDYLGVLSDPRKQILSTPVKFLSQEEMNVIHHKKEISCSVHLNTDTKAYKLDAIERQIPNLIDGMPRTRRKVLAAAIMYFKNNNKERKVFQFSGFVAEKMFYHHGDASLNNTIIGMAQYYPGAHQFQLLHGIGRFGTRHLGHKDAGSPRYINVNLNLDLVKALFPFEELPLLEYSTEDGERAEPKNFVPVLPLAVLESGSNPSEGWKFTAWARTVSSVAAFIEAHIENRPLPTLDIWTGDNIGDLRMYKNEIHSFGKYEYKKNLIITELPLRYMTQTYMNMLTSKNRADWITDIQNYSGEKKIEIHITLRPGAYEYIQANFGDAVADPIESFLCLYKSLKSHLNFMLDGAVAEYGQDYRGVILEWIPRRKQMYFSRFERQKIILEAKIIMQENILRYLSDRHDISALEDESSAQGFLQKQNFIPLNSTLLHSPGYTPSRELAQELYNGSYEYLLSLRERDFLEAARNRRITLLKKMKDDLECVNASLVEMPFAGASTWKAEIREVVKFI